MRYGVEKYKDGYFDWGHLDPIHTTKMKANILRLCLKSVFFFDKQSKEKNVVKI